MPKTNNIEMIKFMEDFLQEYRRPLRKTILVLDNHSVHKSNKFKAAVQNRLNLLFLPKYSSVLNPIERFWSMFKADWAKNMSKMQQKYNYRRMTSDIEIVIGRNQAKLTCRILNSVDPYVARVNNGELV